ncbi:hypothetical protein P43SY_002003 [Pythium insidiosum]|uniref:hydroxyacylglutathione hydrolase n=1 Tax=Pythium insidiosum TaxID=114742 RepID=A0AAD5Q9I8_PYTIN|nr:hypothetical protein P43SY_002003 [Pythium insidiosum]
MAQLPLHDEVHTVMNGFMKATGLENVGKTEPTPAPRLRAISSELPAAVWVAMAATHFPATPFAPFDPIETDWHAFWRCAALASLDARAELSPQLRLNRHTVHVTCEQRPWLLDCRVPADWPGAVLRERVHISVVTAKATALLLDGAGVVMALGRAGLAFDDQLTARSSWSLPLGELQVGGLSVSALPRWVTFRPDAELLTPLGLSLGQALRVTEDAVLVIESGERQVSVRGLSVDRASAWATAIAALCVHGGDSRALRVGLPLASVMQSRDDGPADRDRCRQLSARSSTAMLQAFVPYPVPTLPSLTSFLEALRPGGRRVDLPRRRVSWRQRSKQKVWRACAELFGHREGDRQRPAALSPAEIGSNEQAKSKSSSSARSSQASTLCDLADLADMTTFDDDNEAQDEGDEEAERQQQEVNGFPDSEEEDSTEDDGDDDDDDSSSSDVGAVKVSPKRSHVGFRARLRRSLASAVRSRDQQTMGLVGDSDRSAVERRVETIVQCTLRDESTFEGQVCRRFLDKQRSFRLATAAAGRFYLGQVRCVIGDLVEFMLTYRRPVFLASDDDDALATAVRLAVERFICASLQEEVLQWAAMAARAPHEPRRRRRRRQQQQQLRKWRDLPATSAEFGLPHDVARAVECDATVASAINRLREIGELTAPSSKMQSLVAACHALSAPRASEPSGGKLLYGDADAFLPLLIFAVARSGMRDAFLQPALLAELFPFSTQHGERPRSLIIMLQVEVIPVLSDNYAYLLIDDSTRVAAAVDPVDADKVVARAQALGVTITTILTTHSHWDHAGGNEALVERLQKPSLVVVGGVDDDIPMVTREVTTGDRIAVGALEIEVFHTPCHTRGHVLYLCEGALFTGDTLFVAGCGRFFAGSPAEMHHALNGVVAALPDTTRVFCGHEYTLSNLRFAAHVEPANDAVQRKLAWAQRQTSAGTPTIPSTVADERATNPFLRVAHADVQRFVVAHCGVDAAQAARDPVAVMGALRAAKDSFGLGKGKI